MSLKTCSKCKKKKSLSGFGKSKWCRDGLSYYCKECSNKLARESYPKFKDSQKNSILKRMYGISLEDYNNMLDNQKGVCKLCGSEPRNRGLCVDHCHKTGKVRGLLCISCNTLLGKIETNPSLLTNIQKYLNS